MIDIAFFCGWLRSQPFLHFRFFYYLCGESHFSGYLIAGSSLPDRWQGASLIFLRVVSMLYQISDKAIKQIRQLFKN